MICSCSDSSEKWRRPAKPNSRFEAEETTAKSATPAGAGGKFRARGEPFSRSGATAEMGLVHSKAITDSGVAWVKSTYTTHKGSSLARRLGVPVQLVSSGAEPVLEDADLVRAFSSGESWAARQIWNRHAPMVYRLLEGALGPNGEAEDLTQDVFLRTFSNLPTLRDVDALRSFIYSVAIRTLKWELRRRRVRRILRLSDTGQLPDLPIRGVDSESRQILVRFYGLLEQLRVNDRTAFVLRHMEGLKLEEIAERMGVSLATVKRWVSRASQDVSSLVEADDELSAHFRRRGGCDARG
jgi:RNA polymerase sigma-70 factor (ECF subfamily)